MRVLARCVGFAGVLVYTGGRVAPHSRRLRSFSLRPPFFMVHSCLLSSPPYSPFYSSLLSAHPRTHLSFTLTTSLPQLWWNPEAVWQNFEVWRLLTSFIFFGKPSMSFCFQLYIM